MKVARRACAGQTFPLGHDCKGGSKEGMLVSRHLFSQSIPVILVLPSALHLQFAELLRRC